ncbi:MAG: hypothetical protein P1V51_20165 [Deltaproteobacteria bacterium]|nr:hypothetical protein [Deltaproteobacteria bacterium]
MTGEIYTHPDQIDVLLSQDVDEVCQSCPIPENKRNCALCAELGDVCPN